MKGIYKFNFRIKRMGTLSGIFVALKDDVQWLNGQASYFGEVLGKHSEVFGTLEGDEISLVTEDPIAVEMFEKYNMETGYNPFDYVRGDEEGDNVRPSMRQQNTNNEESDNRG